MLGLYAAAAVGTTIPTVEIAPGVRMPQISLGTCCGSQPSVGLAPWFATGARGVDTAHQYQDQKDIAAVLTAAGAPPRGDVFITTKIEGGFDAAHSCGNGTDGAAKALALIKENLEQLGTDYVDLTLLHKPCPSAAENQAVWKGFEQAVAQNLTRAIGVSNFAVADIESLLQTAKIPPAVNQCQMSVKTHDEDTISYCQKKGIMYEGFFAMRFCDFSSGTLKGIATAHNKSVAQVCLRYLVDRNCIMAVGTGADPSTVGTYAQENVDIFDFKLSADEVAAINNGL